MAIIEDGERCGLGCALKECSVSDQRFDQLCDWLDAPRVLVVDARRLERCSLPRRPARVDAVILDRPHRADIAAWQTTLEALWGVPVVGCLEELPGARAAMQALPPGCTPPSDLRDTLATSFRAWLSLDRLLRLAEARPFPLVPPRLFQRRGFPASLRVAVAFDAAFQGYFPDTLDLLELFGAEVVDFSPLRDESLPADVDMVYLGCGRLDRWAQELWSNQCMLHSVRRHFLSGGRIYAEGSGVAYLCEMMVTPDGEQYPMAGILPAHARFASRAARPEPVDATFARDSWIGESGRRVRGYRDARWQLEPRGQMRSLINEPDHAQDMIACQGLVASQMSLSFAAQPHLLERFFEPLNAPVASTRMA